ncbi:MAG: hypothetical protein FWE95_04670 [Planctomycetaceae bacterium]|nr:hypothetical protein [Planctomycetaceae bacterium]
MPQPRSCAPPLAAVLLYGQRSPGVPLRYTPGYLVCRRWRKNGDWCARADYIAALGQRTRFWRISRLSPTLPPGGRQPTYFETCNRPERLHFSI